MADRPLTGVALITGGSMGIGKALATDLAEAGMRVAVTARGTAELESAAEEIGALAIAGDVRSAADSARSVSTVEAQLGPIDLLVNNAGVNHPGRLWELDPERWWSVVEVSLRGSFNMVRAVLAGMVERRRGRVVNVVSNAAVGPSGGAYSVAKAALIRLTDTLAYEVRDLGVTAFAVSPGWIKTRMTMSIPEFANRPDDAWTSPARACSLVRAIAQGRLDRLSGRVLYATDDIEAVLAAAGRIEQEELYQLRLRTLDGLRR